jgi:hypothetical protein
VSTVAGKQAGLEVERRASIRRVMGINPPSHQWLFAKCSIGLHCGLGSLSLVWNNA